MALPFENLNQIYGLSNPSNRDNNEDQQPRPQRGARRRRVTGALAGDKMRYFYYVIMAFALFSNIAFAQSNVAEKSLKTYPYFASKPRTAQIKDSYKKIEKGMTSKQVTQLLGEPDEIRPLYEPKIKNPKQIGYTHWYLIQRRADKGSQNDKDEKLVRVSYGLDWTVVSVDHWGFDE